MYWGLRLAMTAGVVIILSVCAMAEAGWAPLDQREELSYADCHALLAEWETIKKSGLFAPRAALVNKCSGHGSDRASQIFRYRNPELIAMMAEIYRVEYECYERMLKVTELRDEPCCIEQVKNRGYEAAMDYYEKVNRIALSTYSDAIYDIAVSYFCTVREDMSAYLKGVDPRVSKAFLVTVLTAEYRPDRAVFSFSVSGKGASLDVDVALRAIREVLEGNPDFTVEYRDALESFIAKHENTSTEKAARGPLEMSAKRRDKMVRDIAAIKAMLNRLP